MHSIDLDAKNRALGILRKRKQVIERIEAILLDATPDDLALLRDALSPNGDLGVDSTERGPSEAAQAISTPLQTKPEKRGRKPNLDPAVRKAVAALKTGITVITVRTALEKNGLKLKAKRPSASINSVFKRMESEGLLRQVKEAIGRAPAEYEAGGNALKN